MKPTGMPASAASKAASRLPPSWPSGLVVHCIIERTGRTRRASRPPAMAAAISIAARASRAVTIDSVWTCFVLLAQQARSSWSDRDTAGRSWAETGIQWKETSSRASARRAISATSAIPEGRRSPVSRSATSMPQPSVAA